MLPYTGWTMMSNGDEGVMKINIQILWTWLFRQSAEVPKTVIGLFSKSLSLLKKKELLGCVTYFIQIWNDICVYNHLWAVRSPCLGYS